jgi:hypothetical protein
MVSSGRKADGRQAAAMPGDGSARKLPDEGYENLCDRWFALTKEMRISAK